MNHMLIVLSDCCSNYLAVLGSRSYVVAMDRSRSRSRRHRVDAHGQSQVDQLQTQVKQLKKKVKELGASNKELWGSLQTALANTASLKERVERLEEIQYQEWEDKFQQQNSWPEGLTPTD